MNNLNEIVSCFLMQSNTMTHDEANTILINLSNNEDFYLNSLNIFYSNESSQSTKFFVTQALKNTVQKRWNCISPQFQAEVRKFIISYFFSNPFHKETPIDGLIFQLLFSVLCYEWPGQWPSFFKALFGNTDNSEITNILSLKFISFIGCELQSNSLTSVRAFAVANALESKTPIYFNFIQNLLFKTEVSKEIVISSFSLLTTCIQWIPTILFVESQFFSQLADHFFQNSDCSEAIIPFLTQLITSLNLPPDRQGIISQIFQILMSIKGKITNPLSFVSAIKTCYDFYGQVVEMTSNIPLFKEAINIILNITNETDDLENPELLEICFSFLVEICQRLVTDNSPITANLYLPYTFPILEILYTKISPPYNVITQIDELEFEHKLLENSIYRSNIYSYMKQCINFLISLDENAVINFFIKKIGLLQNLCSINDNHTDASNSDEHDYNIIKITWLVYSAAGSFSESLENKQFNILITSLLELVKNSSPYTITSMITALLQHQRYLKNCPDKLIFLTQKIFELLVNFTEEVQFIALYALKNLPVQCRQIIIQKGLFNDLVMLSNTLRAKLCDDCIIELYNVYGNFIKEMPEGKTKNDILTTILQLPFITTATNINLNNQLLLSLKCHIALQNKINMNYLNFLTAFNFQQLYIIYSKELQNQYQTKQNNQDDLIRSIFLVKSTIIDLITNFVSFCFKPNIVNNFIVPTFMNTFLNDYISSPIQLRTFHTLKFVHSILLRSDVPARAIYCSIFPTTFSMISQNFDDFQEFRFPFYSIITAIIHRHFSFLMELKKPDIDELIQILIYGCNHPKASIAQLSFNLLTDFITNLKGTLRFEELFPPYCLMLIKFIFSILSSLSSKSDFEELVGLVRAIFSFHDEVEKLGSIIAEEVVSVLPMINPSDLIELVKNLTECGAYLEGIRILLKDFVIELGQIPITEELIVHERQGLSSYINESFEDKTFELMTEDITVENQLSEGLRSITIQNHP